MSSTLASGESGFDTDFAAVVPNQISAYFLDLEGVLDRVDTATTYYQALGVERTDGQEKIKSSFHQLLNLLFPPYAFGRSIPIEINPRIERAFQKASLAFAVLASFAKRKEYDSALQSLANRPPVAENKQASPGAKSPHPRLDSTSPAADSPGSTPVDTGRNLNLSMPKQRGVYTESHNAKSNDNRRRCERFKLKIPARVTGHDRRIGKWHEMTETVEVSRTGVLLRLRKQIKPGTVLYLTFPLPSKLRAHGFAEQSYNVYGFVRRVEPPRKGVRSVGVEFIGEHPPSGFLDKPWSVFRPKQWGGRDRRRPDRHEQIEHITIDYFDESMHSLGREKAKTENISRTGLRIFGTTAPAEFDLVMISCARLNFQAMAALRNRYVGKDRLERICVQLVDKEWPLR